MTDPTSGAIKLTVPNHISHLPLVQQAVAHSAGLAGLAPEASGQIQLAVEEAVTNVIKHGYPGGEEESTIDILCETVPEGLRVTVRETGIPFDPSEFPEFHAERVSQDPAVGLGVFLMKKEADEIVFRNRGRDGMETVLVKYSPHSHILDHDAASPPPPSEPHATLEAVPIPPFLIRPMHPDEGIAVARCAWGSYRYSYFNEQVYHPELLVELNATGRMISYVAVTEDGEVFGHAAMVPDVVGEGVAELAAAFVSPRFRGGGALKRITEALLAEGRRRGLQGLYVRAVTSHPYSQKVAHSHGFRDCCLQLACLTPMRFKGIQQGATQREALMTAFGYLHPPRPLSISAPDHHRPIIEKIYQSLDARPRFAEPKPVEPRLLSTVLDLRTDAYGSGHVLVTKIGRDALPTIKKSLKALCLRHADVVYVHLPLEDPGLPGLTPAIEDLDCFFSGVMPGTRGRDALILQYLNNVTVNYDDMKIESPMGQEILEYVRRHDPNEGDR